MCAYCIFVIIVLSYVNTAQVCLLFFKTFLKFLSVGSDCWDFLNPAYVSFVFL